MGYGLTDGSDGDLPKLPAATGLPPAASIDTSVYFTAGRTGSGWHWAVADDAGASPLPHGSGASQSGRLTVTPLDRNKQEDARQLRFSGGQATATISGTAPIDLSRQTNAQLALGFDYRVEEAPTAAVTLGMGCGASCTGTVPLTRTLRSAARGSWQHLDVPLACFAHQGVNMSRVWTPFSLATSGKLALGIADIRLESGAAGTLPCPH